MDIFESDEQQREEELQKWWHDNWKSIISGIVVAFILIIGFHYFKQYQLHQKEIATENFYLEVLNNDAADDESIAKVQGFIKNNKNSLSQLASMQLAKTYISLQKYEDAYKVLVDSLEVGSDKTLKNLATIRAARLAIELKKFDEAQNLLNQVSLDTFESIKSEVNGDLNNAKGDKDNALAMYKKAKELRTTAQGAALDALKLKINALSSVTSDAK